MWILIDAIREGYDFATGSRMLPGSQVKRSFKRGFASYGFNFLTRLFLRSKIHDHQAGFKAFRRKSLTISFAVAIIDHIVKNSITL